MASATDIITYIGVPLAVLGVLPILYTFVLAFLTRQRIRSALVHHGHKPISAARPQDGFSIRGSSMTSLIEVELPRFTIAPLDRHNDDYWKLSNEAYLSSGERQALLSRTRSTMSMIEQGRVRGFLRGGSWRTFHWKKLIVGRKLYRIQYEDELREPAAEVEFSDLTNFLLDWGAVPDALGWEKLKSGGLWTPAGTVLLREAVKDIKKPSHWILRTNVPDDSDGVLTLTIQWPDAFGNHASERGAASLPPGWGRLVQPVYDKDDKEVTLAEGAPQPLVTRIKDAVSSSQASMTSTSFRFRVENNKVNRIYWEVDGIEILSRSEVFQLYEDKQNSLWFACVAASLPGADTAFWGIETPESVSAFVGKPSIPCGVLVLLGLLASEEAPEWSSEIGGTFQGHNMVLSTRAASHHTQFMARRAAEKLEETMPPEQARIHKMNRVAAEQRASADSFRQERLERLEKEERRMKDAIASSRMGHRRVAETCVAWLIKQGDVGKEWSIEMVAEAVLYLLVLCRGEDSQSSRIAQLLEEWMSWSQAGGMKKSHVELIGKHKVEFCYAACLVAVVAEAAGRSNSAGTHMLECLKQWRKVRLG